MARSYIGTSGWDYRHWRDSFYEGAPQRAWLSICGERFSGIEINATFYRLQTQETFLRWYEQTPPGFRFAMKGNRYLTHSKKLNDPAKSIALERERAMALQDKLVAVLWQLPGHFAKHSERLSRFAEALGAWPEVRHAIEFRHPSWFEDEIAECLHWYRIAVVLSDAADWHLWDRVTTDMVYVRLHGHTRTYASAYRAASLERWSRRIKNWLGEGRDVHAYLDNDAEGAAPFDALRLMESLAAPGPKARSRNTHAGS